MNLDDMYKKTKEYFNNMTREEFYQDLLKAGFSVEKSEEHNGVSIKYEITDNVSEQIMLLQKPNSNLVTEIYRETSNYFYTFSANEKYIYNTGAENLSEFQPYSIGDVA